MTTQRDPGGGASRSTDPASGSSAATDVSLREYVASRIDALDRHITAEISSLRRETQAANAEARRAVEVAAHEATDRLAAHNGLIEQMRQQANQFATRESVDLLDAHLGERIGKLETFQSKLTGGIALVLVIGVTNLVKVWAG